MSIIKKYCDKCLKNLDYEDRTFYLNITEREIRANRKNLFLCFNCLKELLKFLDNKNEK